jgi:exodeoxyribonuclease VII large subunit
VTLRRTPLNAATAQLQALSPLSVLARGYALVYGEDGELLRSAEKAHPGQTIRARLASGTLSAQVTSTESVSDNKNPSNKNKNPSENSTR